MELRSGGVVLMRAWRVFIVGILLVGLMAFAEVAGADPTTIRPLLGLTEETYTITKDGNDYDYDYSIVSNP